MKTLILNKLVATAFIACLGFTAASAMAGADENQRMLQQQIMKSKQKLQQAEVAKGAERQKLMGEHMQMMQETMKKMQSMKPKAGMSMQEHEDWINEHQKLMEQMMDQMMGEHHMMMGMDCISMGSGDKHKH